MRNGLMQEIISAAHEYERMEKRLEELEHEVEEEPQRYGNCSICEWQAGERFSLRPFGNNYTISLYVCRACLEKGILDKYETFWMSVNSEKGGE